MAIKDGFPYSEAMDKIAALLDGTQWNPETLEAIADVMTEAGYTLRNYEPPDDAED